MHDRDITTRENLTGMQDVGYSRLDEILLVGFEREGEDIRIDEPIKVGFGVEEHKIIWRQLQENGQLGTT